MSPLPTTTLSQAPTPLGYPCAARRRQGRREWHDKGLQDEGLRQRLVEYVLTRLNEVNMIPSWYPARTGAGAEAPAVAAKRLEEELYFSATSVAEYADEATLHHRLMCLAYPAARSSMQPPVEISVCSEVEHVDAPLTERCETPQRFPERSGNPIHLSSNNLLDFMDLSSPHSVSSSGEGNHLSVMDDDKPMRTPRTEYNPSAFLRSIPHLTGKRTRAQIPLSPEGQGGFNFSSKALFSPKEEDLPDQQ